MATRIKRNKINFKGNMVCIGIDMHILSWQITALVEGEIVLKVNKIEVPFLLITV